MKNSKLVLASMLAFSSATMAFAQTPIEITGSSAFRAATHQAILNVLDPNDPNYPRVYGYTGTSLNSAGQAIFEGVTLTTGEHVLIRTSWAGSVGGVEALAANISAPGLYVPTTATRSANGSSGLAAGSVSEIAEIALSDSWQASTRYIGGTYDTLVDTLVGVIPFQFVRGLTSNTTVQTALAGLDNITCKQARLLFTEGVVPLSFFTANPAHNYAINVLGRNYDSGTRLVAFADSGFGVETDPVQYEALGTLGTSITGLSALAADAGYTSGGTLAKWLNTPVDAGQTFALISYLSINDASAVTNGTKLKYNGVDYSVVNVQEGKYSMWGYAHLLYRSDLGSPQSDVADEIASAIENSTTGTASLSGININTMNVERYTDGGVIVPN